MNWIFFGYLFFFMRASHVLSCHIIFCILGYVSVIFILKFVEIGNKTGVYIYCAFCRVVTQEETLFRRLTPFLMEPFPFTCPLSIFHLHIHYIFLLELKNSKRNPEFQKSNWSPYRRQSRLLMRKMTTVLQNTKNNQR